MALKKSVTAFLAVLISTCSFGQTEDLDQLLQKLQKSLSKVSTASKTYEQAITPLQYGTVKYTVDEIDQKGAKVSYGYEFNLSDVDVNTVMQQTLKDVIMVNLRIRNKQKLVKVYKNNEPQPYDEQLQLQASDIDNAREIVEAIKAIIPVAQKVMAGKLKLNGYDEMITWLTNNVREVDMGGKSVKQILTKSDYVGSLKLTQIETSAKASVEEQFIFNLADINLNSVTFKVTGNRFALNFETLERLKNIGIVKAGKVAPFINEVTIQTNNVDEARDIKTVLGLIIPLAQEKVKADNPKAGSPEEVMEALKALVKDVRDNEKILGQSIETGCVSSITQTNQTTSTVEKNVYTFNWIDVNPNIIKIETMGDRMLLELTTVSSKPVIMHFKNGKLEGYEKQVKIYVEDAEIGRRLKFLADKAVEKCVSTYKEPFSSNPSEIVNWLKQTIESIKPEETSVKQIFEATPDNLNRVKFTKIAIKESTSSEEVYEFNVSDLNPSMDVIVKNKVLYVKLETNFKTKIINAYKDGKIQPYVSSVEIAVQDIESSRGVIAGFKKCIEAFKSK